MITKSTDSVRAELHATEPTDGLREAAETAVNALAIEPLSDRIIAVNDAQQEFALQWIAIIDEKVPSLTRFHFALLYAGILLFETAGGGKMSREEVMSMLTHQSTEELDDLVTSMVKQMFAMGDPDNSRARLSDSPPTTKPN